MSGAKLNTFLKWQDSLEYLMLEKTPKKKKKKSDVFPPQF